MSAIALTILENCVVMVSDGIASDPATGAVAGCMSKVSIMPDLNAVIGITGVGGFDHLLGWYLPPHVRSFDELIDILPDLIKHCHESGVASGLFSGVDFSTNVCVAGWSDRRQKFEAWRVVSYAKKTLNLKTGTEGVLEPWTLLPIPEGGSWCSTSVPPELHARFRLSDPHPDDNPLDTLTRMICAARANSGSSEKDGGMFNAGGYIQVAMLERGQATSWISHRWPEDEIGRPVDPGLGLPMPQYLMDRDAKAA